MRRGDITPFALSMASDPLRPPSSSRSMGRKTNSMYTVCGQPHPHHTRPNNAEKRKIAITALPSSSIRISVSVGRKVLPSSVNSRRGTSSRMSGLPIQRRCGSATKNAINE